MNITKSFKNITTTLALATLVACSSGGSCPPNLPVQEAGKLVFVAPSILPSLANKVGVNYMGVYNPSTTTISGISYNVGQQVGAGSSIVLDAASTKTCASIAAQSSCFLKFSVPESTIAGGTVVTATNSSGQEAATPLAIGVQQVPYTESANANGIGLYFYPKAQYSANGVPFILVTAVVQSPNVGNINTIQLVDESGNVIPDQTVTSNNSGVGKAALQMGDVVEISLPIPQGINLTQNFKVQTSSQSLVTTTLNSIATKLNLKSLEASSNGNISSTTYILTTQGNNINLQFTPNQVFLTQANPIQYGYLYNIGDLTASQINVTSASSNVKVTAADTMLNGQRVIKVTYELINTSVAATSNVVTVTANNPAGQTQTSTGGTSQNINPLPVPTPSPTPTPTPSPTPPVPPPAPQIVVSSSANPVAGGACAGISASIPAAVSSPVTVTFTISPVAAGSYGFGSGPGGAPFASTAICTITNPSTTCSTGDGGDLCAATGSSGTSITVTGSASGYSNGSLQTTITRPMYAYALAWDSTTMETIVNRYSINTQNGSLTYTGESTVISGAISQPGQLGFYESKLFVPNYQNPNQTFSMYGIDPSTGIISLESTMTAGFSTFSAAATGTYVLVSDGSQVVNSYTISGSNLVFESSFTIPNSNEYMYYMTVDPIYNTMYGGYVYMLTTYYINPQNYYISGGDSNSPVFSDGWAMSGIYNNSYLYVATWVNTIHKYSIPNGGNINFAESQVITAPPGFVGTFAPYSISFNGNYAYVVNGGYSSNNSILIYLVDPATGNLTYSNISIPTQNSQLSFMQVMFY